MRRVLSCLPLALLFLATVVPSNGQKAAAGAGAGAGERELVVGPGAPLTVECALRPEQQADWQLDGGRVPPDMQRGEAAGGAGAGAGLTARLTAPAARPHHVGVYTCSAGSPRVRVRLSGAAPATEAAAAVDAAADAADDAADGKVEYFDLRGNFSLDCSSLVADDKTAPLVWRKNGTVVEAGTSGHVVLLPAGGVPRALLTLGQRAVEADYGNYTCSARGASLAWQLRVRPHAKLPADTGVVEGQKLKLVCKLVGRPYPPVVWTFSNSSETVENGTEVTAAMGARATLRASEQGVEGGELLLEPAERADAGWFRCEAAGGRGTPAVTRLRVKDMYAALWPFLGICAEVFVLCAIILVYEKRRTKPELEDSDTDNHDQKKS